MQQPNVRAGQPARGQQVPRWHRHGMVRPTVGALAVTAIGAILCFFGLVMDDRALMASVVAVAVTLPVSLTVALLSGCQLTVRDAQMVIARARASAGRDGYVAFLVSGGIRRWLLPHRLAACEQWEQIDQRARVIRSAAGRLPPERGAYRLASVSLTWHDPFGMWKLRRVIGVAGSGARNRLDENRPVLVLPDVSGAASGLPRRADQRLQGQGNHDITGGVRRYTPGDPPRMISWRHTAHRGRLMTRETSAETRPAMLLVVDTTTGAGLDASAALALRAMRSAPAGVPVVVSDGVRFHRDRYQRLCVLAAAQPDPAARDEGRERSDVIVRRAASWRGPLQITVFTPDVDAPLTRALRESPLRDDLHVVTTAPRMTDASRQPSVTVGAAFTDVTAGRTRHSLRMHRLVARGVEALSLMALLAVTGKVITGLIVPSGAWPWFAAIAMGGVAVEGMIPARDATMSLRRAAATSGAVAAAALALAVVRIRQAQGIWLFNPGSHVIIPATRDAPAVMESRSAVAILRDTLAAGYSSIYGQYPPVRVDASADVLIVLLLAGLAMLVRLLLIEPRLSPTLALLPVTAMAGSYWGVGLAAPMPLIAVTVACWLLLTWSPDAPRMLLPVPAMAVTLIVALVVTLTPVAVGLARRVDISLGRSAGLFSSEAVSPLVDLKRGLQSGSTSTMFTYVSDRSLYFRMTTLADFNGDTWSYGSNRSVSGGAWRRYSESPLLRSLESANYPNLSTGDRKSSGEASNESAFLVSASVTVSGLVTRFLPVPGEAIRLIGAAEGSNWRLGGDGGVVASSGQGTGSGMRYGVRSMYVTPLTRPGDFVRISSALAARERLGHAGNSTGIQRYAADGGTGTGKRILRQYGTLSEPLPEDARRIIDDARRAGVATTGADADEQTDAMRYLVRYFTTGGFTYSLDAPDGNGRSNLQVIGNFLRTKRGYCIHYASALAVLGRAMGVATRMVLGYSPGTGHADAAGTRSVEARQLHSWVEAYIDGVGWVPFDVTPADDSQQAESSSASPSVAPTTSSSTDVTTESPSPSPSATTSSATASPRETQPSARSQRPQDESRLERIRSSRMWATALLVTGLVLALTAVVLAPAWLRLRRRRRRYAIVAHGGPHAGIMAWRELVDTAVDIGVDWSVSAGDLQIAALIARRVRAASPEAASAVTEIVRRAATEAFGRHRPSRAARESANTENSEQSANAKLVKRTELARRAIWETLGENRPAALRMLMQMAAWLLPRSLHARRSSR